MNLGARLTGVEHRLDIVAGVSDGMLTALTLAGGRMLGSASALSGGLALRVAAAASVTQIFVFFVARYSQFRHELAHAERQLNMIAPGHLATTRLGRVVLHDALAAALLSGGCSFGGALIPLGLSVLVPDMPLLSVALTIGLLAVLGVVLARTVHGDPRLWAVGLVAGGFGVSYLGVQLDIVG
jgi:predicted membrane protein (TIGR00267 family)